MTDTRKRKESETQVVAKFELVLPTEFDVKPIHVIPLPKGWTAEVYIEKDMQVSRYAPNEYANGDGDWVKMYVNKDGWHVVVRNAAGKQVDRHSRHDYHDSEKTFTDPLDLKLYIERWAVTLSKTKTTVVVEEE